MSEKIQSDEREEFNYFVCSTCGDEKELSHEELVKHLQEIHKIDTKNTQGKRETLVHLDGDTWYSWSFKWTFPNCVFEQHNKCKRQGEDLEMWSGA